MPAYWIAEAPQEELPPHITMVFPVGFGFNNGNGSLSVWNNPVAAVETARGRTTAFAKGIESGTAETRISRRVEYF